MPGWNWDEAATESGVVHQSTAGTDHTDAGILTQGYDYATFSEISPTPVACWPFHEDSGTTANDVAGTNDGTYTGATLGVNGMLGTTAASCDATDDYIGFPSQGSLFDGSNSWTATVWLKPDNAPSGLTNIFHPRADYDVWLSINSGKYQVGYYDGALNTGNGNDATTGEWMFLAAVWDAADSTFRLFENATQTGSIGTGTPNSVGSTNAWNGRVDNDKFLGGDYADGRVWDTALTQSQIQTLYDVVASPGEWVGEGKLL